jgi:hypothetical protein
METFEIVTKIFWNYTVKIINFNTQHMQKMPMSTQLCATWHTDSLDMVVLTYTGASCYHNCCIDGDTSPEYFGYTMVSWNPLAKLSQKNRQFGS